MKRTALILGCAAALAVVCAGTACAKSPVILAGSTATRTSEEEKNTDAAESSGPESEGNSTADAAGAGSNEAQDGEESSAQTGSICIYGPVTEISGDSLTIDNRSPSFAEGEVIVTLGGDARLADSQSGLPVGADAFAQNDFVYAYIGDTMTLSLPPIVNARVLLTESPQDARAPLFGTVSEISAAEDGSVQLTLAGGTASYTVPADCELKPWRTRNIVTAADLAPERELLLWADETGNASRIVLFEE